MKKSGSVFMRKVTAAALAAVMIAGSAAALPLTESLTGIETGITADAASYNGFSYYIVQDEKADVRYAAIYGYTGTAAEVVIPAEIEGFKVTRIMSYAFSSNRNITKVTIPEGVTSIEIGAFMGCRSLEEVNFPSTVTSLEDNVLRATKWYSNQPDGVLYHDGWLCGYKGTMPEGTTINVQPGTKGIAGESFRRISGLASVTIPDSVVYIEREAFGYCDGLKSITIPSSAKSLGTGAFRGCTGLTSVSIPKSITEIETKTFNGCSALENITLHDGITSVASDAFEDTAWLGSTSDGAVYLGKVLYKYNGDIPYDTVLTVKTGTKVIADSVFEGAEGLAGINIPDSVTHIGNSAFSGCSSLSQIRMSKKLKSIGRDAFKNCSSLTDISLPDTVGYIGSYGFYQCTSLKSIHVPAGVKQILSMTFTGCTALEDVTLPDGLLLINSSAFQECSSLSEVSLPSSLRKINSSAFYGCAALKSVIIPDSVTEIGERAFEECIGLESVKLSKNIKVLSKDVFSLCTSLEEIEIPKGVTEIGVSAFALCSGLKEVVLPSTVTKIGSGSFQKCTSLRYITIPKTVTVIEYDIVFLECSELTIRGVKGTQAENYAATYNIPFEEIESLANNSTLSSTTINLGTELTVNGSADGGAGRYQYAVLYKKTTDTKWATAQDFKSNAKIRIKPGKAVKYDVCVKVKDFYGTIVKKYYVVTVNPKLVNSTTVSADQIKAGDKVTVKASASGGSKGYKYTILYKKASDSSWATVQNYSTNTTVDIKLKKPVPYEIYVKVKDSSGNIVKKYFTVNVTA